jgi:hypothetical protein
VLFAGLSEYFILWQSHRKQEYGIVLASAVRGISQVMFLVLSFAFFISLFIKPFESIPLRVALRIFYLKYSFVTDSLS